MKSIFLRILILCTSIVLFVNVSKVETRSVSASKLRLAQANMSWTYVNGSDSSTSNDFKQLRTKFLKVNKKKITYPNIPNDKQSWTHINSEESNSPSSDNEFTNLRKDVFGIDKKKITYPNIPSDKQSWTHINSDGNSSPSTKAEFTSLRKKMLK